EAFAAAEATYRAYVAAGNEIDLNDPATFEPVFALTTGDVNSDERKNLSKMAAQGWTVSGDTAVIWVEGTAWIPEDDEVLSRACIDVSAIEVVDSSGVSQVQPDRRDQYAIDLTFTAAADALHGLRIESSVAVEDDRCLAE
ncbi:MAG TPA: hypothetical protein VFN24_03830, partial [Microbacterium sp.]|nr:hypothetical protein [Microbacterium sp.]